MNNARAIVACASVLVVAACATASTNARDERADAGVASMIDVDAALLPDDAGRVGGVALRYCLHAATSAGHTAGTKWPKRIVPENRRAARFVVSARDDAGRTLMSDDDGVVVGELAPSSCARIVVDVGRVADTIDDRDLSLRAGDDLIVTPDVWLWHPDLFTGDARMFVALDSGAFDALLPWGQPRGRERVEVGPSTYALRSDAAFGHFPIDVVDAGGARFSVARLDDGRAPEKLDAWLAQSASAVSTVLGHYPFARVNVLIVPTHVTQAIVEGFFSRGGGPTATFFVGEGDPAVSDDDLDGTGRWALTHELAHPLLPPVDVEDAWLNEGLATFHQDLLARRAGLLVDDAAYWHELVIGLKTGAEQASKDRLTVADASSHMRELGAYQHAYFAGDAIMLLAEVEARKHGASLDDFVRVVRAKFSDDRPHAARELLLDVEHGGDERAAQAAQAIASAYAAHAGEPFPSTEGTLADLGVTVDDKGAVHLDDGAPLAEIRRAITAVSTSPTAALH